ncbi:MAG: zinc ribbon domain-containing protein [bacterium]
MIAALIIGTVLAVSALAFVLYPLFFNAPRKTHYAPVVPRQSEQDSAVAALREIEFDRATGKLSDVDYSELKARYTQEAVVAMRRQESRAAGVIPLDEDAIEAAVRAYREQHPACPSCGPRPEDDAAFCSNCGRYLHNRCADCGAPVVAHDARYCITCGNQLAA